MPPSNKGKKTADRWYWRVIITYSDGETSGNRVFKVRAKAEKWAARQEKSAVVKRTKVEEFVRDTLGWLKRAQNKFAENSG
jgi:hypothetical protein